MEHRMNELHPLYRLFRGAVGDSVGSQMGASVMKETEDYLTGLLVSFLHADNIFAIRNEQGERLQSVTSMVEQADVLLGASSFDREREVHKHIGDYILFWSGVFPEFLDRVKVRHLQDILCDYTAQGKESYYVVSTFDHEPYLHESKVYYDLSQHFEGYASCLNAVRKQLPYELPGLDN